MSNSGRNARRHSQTGSFTTDSQKTENIQPWSSWESQPLVEVKLAGLGPKSKEKLIQAGIHTIGDLLCFLPKDYLDFSQVAAIPEAPLEQPVHIRGQVLSKKMTVTHYKRIPVLEILVDDGAGTLRVLWYRQAYFNEKIVKGHSYSFFGKIKFDKMGRTMTNPRFETEGEELMRQIQPVYKQIGGLRSDQISHWVLRLLVRMPSEEGFSFSLAENQLLPSRQKAFMSLHNPPDTESVTRIQSGKSPACHRLILDEFLAFQIRLQQLVALSQSRDHPIFAVERDWLDRFYRVLPFRPTADQHKVIGALFEDLKTGRRLHALIQGDVGCGKTLVGLAAAYLFHQAGFQSALLCPTAVLAHQHHENASRLLAPLGMRVGLLTGRSQAEELAAVAACAVDLTVGTHKLFQKDVRFPKLGLAMIDEQHRFGVDQRGAFLKKGTACHYLAFSATPIPRSLAMTLYGDYQVLQIKEKPGNRPHIRTILKKSKNRDQIIRFVKSRLRLGESVFWVFPLIEGEEDKQEQSALAMYESFSRDVFGSHIVGLVHGRMDKDRVQQTMGRFRRGELQVLVATTVIEVGVDVPTASIMVVESANQFGLSQLHQLRGRVGRGDGAAFCFLVLQEPLPPGSLQRMRLLEASNDGFEIAEFDLKQRGAGELIGKKQTGLTSFRLGDPWRHRELMTLARKEALSQLGSNVDP